MSLIRTIVRARGGSLSGDGLSGQIPAPGHSAKDRSVSLSLTSSGRILIYCFSATDWREVRASLIADGLARPDDFRTDSRHDDEQSRRARTHRALSTQGAPSQSLSYARKAWLEASGVSGRALVYLRLRSLGHIANSEELASHRKLALSAQGAQGGRTAPALLARLTDSKNRFAGVQATFLFRDRSTKDKLRLTYGRLKGSAVRLDQPGAELVVGEGLESSASAGALFDRPAFAALSAQNLACFVAPEGVGKLIIAADHDEAGRRAASECARLNLAMGRKVDVRLPEQEGADWNDVVCGSRTQDG